MIIYTMENYCFRQWSPTASMYGGGTVTASKSLVLEDKGIPYVVYQDKNHQNKASVEKVN
jgi:hypothetical protein